MDEFEKTILVEFLGQNWELFKNFCEKYSDEETADKIYKDLGGKDDD